MSTLSTLIILSTMPSFGHDAMTPVS